MRAIERRAYLRIHDSASVQHLAVTRDLVASSSAESLLKLGPYFSMRQQLYRLELEARELQREIAEMDRALGSFCRNLNQRLELIAATLSPDGQAESPNVVDISPAGISYISRDFYSADDLLAIRIDLTQGALAAACFGRVCYCLLMDDDEYRLGVQFISLNTTTEALLERHVTALQTKERKQRLHSSGKY
jgi:hypothetical protein